MCETWVVFSSVASVRRHSDAKQCFFWQPLLKAVQQRIDALSRHMLADLAGNQLVYIASEHPHIFHFTRRADSVSQMVCLMALHVLKAQLQLQFHLRHTHFGLVRVWAAFAAASWQRKTE